MRWRLILPEHLHLRLWGDAAIVYHSLSGDTHLIDAATAALIEQLRQAPASAESLAAWFDSAPEPSLCEQIQHSLSKLAALGMVKRIEGVSENSSL